ncbi:hypothetical protein GUITHDRAFT_118073 [Guillardia theta CCMP2712]|uniref:Deacetylase sirtuin-type domain-containing protein n=2 Tax=Guillardia theta TaxID=55529 RepID=L1IHT4_GUITC|nr:hypothetical protein GUITHDRAFT_118073 [Guillardia theta CCMP2712]EKX35798.1 hypothetical protein GUITHDRAFT_118073 [Guillardia theta CCMP2712]|eukprot:XP_005822778.1 hypothetical protein GUITHDRAFT_118073 [Guillardia theta CCMP2712]
MINSCLRKRFSSHVVRQSNPSFEPPTGHGQEQDAAYKLASWIDRCSSQRIVALTGAGVSTESGIPDYRSPNGSYSKGHKPIMHNRFMTSVNSRRRYWARSFFGWQPLARARPNLGHVALQRLEGMKVFDHIVTQNVDGLHQKAGSVKVLDLHGRNDIVRCMSCGNRMSRQEFHDHHLEPANREWLSHHDHYFTAEMRADGDVNLTNSDFEDFHVPECKECGGIMKPDVVFFGDIVPKDKKDQASELVQGASGLLVIGSSVSVLSSFRLVQEAHRRKIPIAAINIGETRMDKQQVNHLKIHERCGPVLEKLVKLLQR